MDREMNTINDKDDAREGRDNDWLNLVGDPYGRETIWINSNNLPFVNALTASLAEEGKPWPGLAEVCRLAAEMRVQAGRAYRAEWERIWQVDITFSSGRDPDFEDRFPRFYEVPPWCEVVPLLRVEAPVMKDFDARHHCTPECFRTIPGECAVRFVMTKPYRKRTSAEWFMFAAVMSYLWGSKNVPGFREVATVACRWERALPGIPAETLEDVIDTAMFQAGDRFGLDDLRVWWKMKREDPDYDLPSESAARTTTMSVPILSHGIVRLAAGRRRA